MTNKPNFDGEHYKRHDYGKLWKHIAISYECKQCPEQFVDEASCLKHVEAKHGKK